MTPTEQILSALDGHGCDPKQNGKGWSARCPAHEDNNPSLSISTGEDGRVLAYCHAGCDFKSICAEVGLRQSDLMPENSVDIDRTQAAPKKKQVSSNGKAPRTYKTTNAAVEALERFEGERSGLWTYRNGDGNPVGVVVRWDKDGDKTYKQVSRSSDGWICRGMPEPRRLYGLPGLADAERVFITEGEKAADAALAIGLTATTASQGAHSPKKTDWSTLAGKECVILPDNNEPGEKYAEAVSGLLAKLTPPATVKIVNLDGLPDGGDIDDWVEARRDTDKNELRQQLEHLADKANVIRRDVPQKHIQAFQPFPTNVFPEPIRGYVLAAAKALRCDVSYLALPMLSVLAGAIGNTSRIRLKSSWSEPAIIWAAIVGESGTMKSPALELVLKPIRERQCRAIVDCEGRALEYRDELLRYDRELADWKKQKDRKVDPPGKPAEPVADRSWCDDPTIEALAVLLLNNWRGILMARDELAGWFAGFDRYSQGNGGDAPRWLEMFGGRPMVIDRKTGTPKTISIPRAAVSVIGAIQPGIIRRCLGQEHRENGLAARLLLSYPPPSQKEWTEDEIAPELEEGYTRVLEQLYQQQGTPNDDGGFHPVAIPLGIEAKEEWVRFYNEHAQEQLELSGDLAAAWSKLEGYAARFALIIHCVRWAASDPTLETGAEIDKASIEAGIRLARWFGQEARRILLILDESDEDCQRRQLVELIQRKGGRITVRELMRSSQKWKTADQAEIALRDLVKANYGHIIQQPTTAKGGRPTELFVLNSSSDVDKT